MLERDLLPAGQGGLGNARSISDTDTVAVSFLLNVKSVQDERHLERGKHTRSVRKRHRADNCRRERGALGGSRTSSDIRIVITKNK